MQSRPKAATPASEAACYTEIAIKPALDEINFEMLISKDTKERVGHVGNKKPSRHGYKTRY